LYAGRTLKWEGKLFMEKPESEEAVSRQRRVFLEKLICSKCPKICICHLQQ
jgi:hypothetical protein